MKENLKINSSIETETTLKEKIAIIENLKIGAAQKANLVLILLGMKPATELLLYQNNDPLGKIENVLLSCGLSIARGKQHEKSSALLVAQNIETINQLAQVSGDKDHEEYGRLMGYPESAIAAFSDKAKQLDENTYSKLVEENKDIRVGYFIPSKDNYQSESKIMEEWNKAIKNYAPELYDSLQKN